MTEWTDFLALPGTTGGFSATDVKERIVDEVRQDADTLLGTIDPQSRHPDWLFQSGEGATGYTCGDRLVLPPPTRDMNHIVEARRDVNTTAKALR